MQSNDTESHDTVSSSINETPVSSAETGKDRFLVNPLSLKESLLRIQDSQLELFDVSFLRIVAKDDPTLELKEDESIAVQLLVDRHTVYGNVRLKSRGKGWIRFEFEKIAPSSQAHLRSFLSPKKVGESILLDAVVGDVHHYHGLNEAEMWADEKGGILFTYLDSTDPSMQFIIRVKDMESVLRVGRMSRRDFMELQDLDGELILNPMTDREMFTKLSDCRDIITNFRPTGQTECALKQRLLKLLSETLYSTSTRVNMWVPRTPRPTTTETIRSN